jgi:hypothetical protein
MFLTEAEIAPGEPLDELLDDVVPSMSVPTCVKIFEGS